MVSNSKNRNAELNISYVQPFIEKSDTLKSIVIKEIGAKTRILDSCKGYRQIENCIRDKTNFNRELSCQGRR